MSKRKMDVPESVKKKQSSCNPDFSEDEEDSGGSPPRESRSAKKEFTDDRRT
jgi:hypothetical protein